MRPLKDIVRANREAEKLGIKTATERPVGTAPASRATLSPERMKKLGLDKY